MKKNILNSLFLVSLCFITEAQAAEQWECAIDLHQGDQGSLSLKHDNDSLTGSLEIKRSDITFEQEVEGRWLGNEVELKRLVSSTNSQVMQGVSIRLGTQHMKIGGRYAEGFNGVWSADCDLVATTAGTQEGQAKTKSSEVPPSTSVRASPFTPTSNQKITFAAQASHPDGVESIEFYLGDKQIKSCQDTKCSFKYGPIGAGKYNWHVIATSKSGAKNTKETNSLEVLSAIGAGACSIQGIATGSAVAQSGEAELRLSGQGNNKSVSATARFDAGTYEFKGLPKGDYTLTVVVPGRPSLLVSPSSASVSCDDAGVVRQNFVFN